VFQDDVAAKVQLVGENPLAKAALVALGDLVEADVVARGARLGREHLVADVAAASAVRKIDQVSMAVKS